jgi:hypothetical protein
MTARKLNLIDTSQKHGVRKAKYQNNILIFNFNYLMQNKLAKVKAKTPR